jgi:hypothetical protein
MVSCIHIYIRNSISCFVHYAIGGGWCYRISVQLYTLKTKIFWDMMLCTLALSVFLDLAILNRTRNGFRRVY